MPRPSRFAVHLTAAATDEDWRAKGRQAEELGYDVLLVPLLIGGIGNRMLKLSAEHADIAAFTGATLVSGNTTGKLTPTTAEQLDERVGRYLQLAEGRKEPAELNLLIQMVVVTDDRE